MAKIKSSVSGSGRKDSSSSGSSKSGGKKERPDSSGGQVIRSSVSSQSDASGGSKVVKSQPTPARVQQSASAPTQRDEAVARLSDARSHWDHLASRAALTSLINVMESLTGDLDSVAQELRDVRARGYRFGRGWEDEVDLLQKRWNTQKLQSRRLIDDQRRNLQGSIQEIDQILDQASRNFGLIATVDDRLGSLESNINAIENQINGTFNETQQKASSLQREVNQARFLLDALDLASFELFPEEHPIAATEVVWESDREQPEGILFLTNGRVIFEQREERATKKILFITTEKELIKEKLWESPVGAIAEIEAEDKSAFLSHKEMLTLRFTTRTRELPSDVTLRLKDSDNETWLSLIRRVKSGQIDTERFDAPAPTATATAAPAAAPETPSAPLPTKCPSCGGKLPTIFKGMQQVTCDYCGSVIPL